MSVKSPDLAKTATLLAENRLKPRPLPVLDPSIRPQSIDQAYAVQPILHNRLEKAGLGARIGYKIGCTTPVMQDFLGIRHPCAGGVMAKTVHHNVVDLALDDFSRIGVECEIAVVLGKDLTPGEVSHDRDSVVASIDTCMVAAEIVDNRYADFHAMGTPSLVADDFFGAGCVLGDPVGQWRSLDLVSIEGRILVNDVEVGCGTGAAVLGHPLEAVAWLANLKTQAGETLKAGEIILTGSLVETNWPENAGDDIIIDINDLGSVRLTLR